MTNSSPSPALETPRRLRCPRCGAGFDCQVSGTCWCADEAARLPLPPDGADCLCPSCLRAAAGETRSPV